MTVTLWSLSSRFVTVTALAVEAMRRAATVETEITRKDITARSRDSRQKLATSSSSPPSW
jgi:hypothetical protein